MRPFSLSYDALYFGLNPLRKSRNSFIVSVRLTVVPQIARISSGSSDGAALAERLGAEDGGLGGWVMSELRLLGSAGVGRVERRVGVNTKEEWMSPRRFIGVLLEGLLNGR